MPASFYGNIDLNKNQLQNVTLHQLASAPSNPTNGQIYFNTSTAKPMMYDGAAWIDLTASGTIRDLVGDFSAAAGTVPTTGTGLSGAILKGDSWYITVAGTITGVEPIANLNVGDLLIARVDGANTGGEFFAIKGSEFAATTTVSGIVTLATEAEVLAKSSTTKAVTPADLATFARMQVVSVTTDGTTTTYTVNHTLAKAVGDLQIQVRDGTSGNIIWGYTITPTDTTKFDLSFNPAYPVGSFKVILNAL